MTSQSDFSQPPGIAVWLVNLFTPAEAAESIQGDLLEEFFHLASKSGGAFARSWYWGQTVKTVAHLAVTGFRAAPWSTAAAVAGGFLLIKFGATLPERAMLAVLDKYQVYENHFDAYKFLAGYGMLICHVIALTFVGGIVAAGAKGREMTATLTLALIQMALAAAGSLMMLLDRTGRYGSLPLPWVIAFSIATIAGGAIVRTSRSAATTRPSAA